MAFAILTAKSRRWLMPMLAVLPLSIADILIVEITQFADKRGLPTFGGHASATVGADTWNQLFIPKAFAIDPALAASEDARLDTHAQTVRQRGPIATAAHSPLDRKAAHQPISSADTDTPPEQIQKKAMG
jgi:hypothetical protein